MSQQEPYDPYSRNVYEQNPSALQAPYSPTDNAFTQYRSAPQFLPNYPQPLYQVPVQYVGVGLRFVALLIDSIIVGALGAMIVTRFSQEPALGSSLAILARMLYYIILEATRGATLGKMALGLRVVKVQGGSIGWSEAIIRNLLALVDYLPFLYLVGAITVWSTARRQRLGDLAAGTVVIKSR